VRFVTFVPFLETPSQHGHALTSHGAGLYPIERFSQSGEPARNNILTTMGLCRYDVVQFVRLPGDPPVKELIIDVELVVALVLKQDRFCTAMSFLEYIVAESGAPMEALYGGLHNIVRLEGTAGFLGCVLLVPNML
jgi:hypothetical protein